MDNSKFAEFAEAVEKYEAAYQQFNQAMIQMAAIKSAAKARLNSERQADQKRQKELERLLSADAAPKMRASWETELAALTTKNYQKTTAEQFKYDDAYKTGKAALADVQRAEDEVTRTAKAAIDEVKAAKDHAFRVVPGMTTLHRNLDDAQAEFIYKV